MALLDTLTYIGEKAQVAMVIGSVPQDGSGDIFIVYVNPPAARLFGYSSQEEMQGLDVRTLMPPHIASGHQKRVDAYIRRDYVKESTIMGSWRHLQAVKKDGSTLHMSANVCDISGACGSRLLLAFFQDRTLEVQREMDLCDALDKANTAKQNFEKLINAIDENNLVVHMNPRGFITDANSAYCELVGMSRQELVGNHHSALVPHKARHSKSYHAFWHQLRAGKPYKGTYERLTADGSSIWIAGSYIPMKDEAGHVVEILKIANDITEQIQDKIDLQTKNTYLEHAAKILRHDMHSGINTYMPRGLKSLERRLAQDPELVDKLSLDMPMRLIKDGLAHTQKVYSGVKEFTNLVKPGMVLDTEEHDLREILSQYLATTTYKKMVVLEELFTTTVNAPLFCTAVDNLIRNGLKYNDSPSKAVRIYRHKSGDLAIEDNGRGMSQKEFEEYSKPYVRKQGQVESGTGLGLNICIAILREHGFSVTCHKVKPHGTLIRIQTHD